MTARPLDTGPQRPWGFLLAILGIGALVLAVAIGPGLLASTPAGPSDEPIASEPVSAGTGSSTSPSAASPSAGPAASAGPLIVTAAEGAFTAAYADGAITIYRGTEPRAADALGFANLPAVIQPAFERPSFRGSEAWTIGCPDTAGSGRVRIFFGTITPAKGAQYLGPTATGAVSPEGLFLYVLAAGDASSGTMEVDSIGGSASADASLFDAVLLGGRTPANGCQVIG